MRLGRILFVFNPFEDLEIVPVINKVDLVHARVDEVLLEMEQSLAIESEEVIRASAKTGIGIDDLLAAIIDRIPPPQGDPEKVLQAMIFPLLICVMAEFGTTRKRSNKSRNLIET